MEQTEKISSEFVLGKRIGDLTTVTILVVDTDVAVLTNIKTQLDIQYNIICTDNGKDALQHIQKDRPDLILCDNLIMAADRVSFLHVLKQHAESSPIPVILLSDRASEGEIEVYDTEADDYLIKPFSPKELMARVRLQLNIRSTRENNEAIKWRNGFTTEMEEQKKQNEILEKSLTIIEQSNKRYHSMLMESPFAFCVMMGNNMVVTLANDLMKSFWGKGTNIEGRTLLEILPELEDQVFPGMIREVYTTGVPVYANEILARLTHNGVLEDHYFNIVYQPHHEPDKTVSGITTIAYEVTEMVLARKRIEQSEHRYREMVFSSPSMIAILKGKEMIIDIANDAILETWGKGKDVFGKSLLTIMPEIVVQGFGDLFHQVYTTGKPNYGYEVPVQVMRNGKSELSYYTFVYQAQKDINDEIDGVAIIATEVTPQAELNKKIKESEEQFQLLVGQAPVAICILKGKDYTVEIANEFYLQLVEKEKEFIGKPLFQSLPELKTQGIKELLDNVLQTGIPFYGNELEVNMLRNEKREQGFFNFVYQPLREADEKITGIIVVVTEVTEQVISRKRMEVQTKLFEDMLMTSPGFVCTLSGPDHVHEMVNEQYQGLFGRRKIKGKPIMVALPELEGQGFDKLLNHVYNTGEPYLGIDIPIMLARDENLAPELRYFNFSYQAMYDENKHIYSILVLGYEVTEQMNAKKRIEESENHFRLMSDIMPAKITNADPAGGVTYCNKEWLDFTGVNFEDFKNFGYHNVMHPDELDEFQNRLQKALQTGTDLEMEMRFMNLAGEYKWHLNRASPIKDENGNVRMWIGVTTEIQKIKSEERRKEEFLKMVSHELKTPISSIKGYVQLLLRMLQEEKENHLHLPQFESFLIRVDVQVIRLTRLISEILDLSRLEENKLELQCEVFHLNKLLIDTIEDIRYSNLDFTINIIHYTNYHVYGDKDRIGQVIINLINNAIKYSPTKETIDVRIHQEKKNYVSVSIKDYGIGIDKKDQPKIFERFYRVAGKNESVFSGFGIGLFIANEIILRHNGAITIESEKGEGSVFTFSLPCEAGKDD